MLLGDLDVRLEPWAVDYGSETPGIGGPDAGDEPVATLRLDVECAPGDWTPRQPQPQPVDGAVTFVDGVRRIEGRLVVMSDSRVLHGAIGSYGVGSVLVAEGRAAFDRHRIGRCAVLGGGAHFDQPITLGPGLSYAPASVADDDADAPVRGLHAQMREAEGRFAAELVGEGRLVIADGPLNIGPGGTGEVIGFVKRLFRLYVEGDQLRLVGRLPAGARSPVFLIEGGRFSRYSWFLRLAPPLPMEAPFTGLARLEVAERVGAERAVALADAVSGWLPRFVPSRTRDPRAPQNLLPIGALEQHLRRLLGDARLIHRRLAALLASESVHA